MKHLFDLIWVLFKGILFLLFCAFMFVVSIVLDKFQSINVWWSEFKLTHYIFILEHNPDKLLGVLRVQVLINKQWEQRKYYTNYVLFSKLEKQLHKRIDPWGFNRVFVDYVTKATTYTEPNDVFASSKITVGEPNELNPGGSLLVLTTMHRTNITI